jgi:hypothetical protein
MEKQSVNNFVIKWIYKKIKSLDAMNCILFHGIFIVYTRVRAGAVKCAINHSKEKQHDDPFSQTLPQILQ